jgi:membrane-anchored protein YejM (alkaline phosphatase superfamily)
MSKGRQSKGEKHGLNLRGDKNGFHKLTENEAREIKYENRNLSYKDIAEKYNIACSTVGAIRRNVNWKYIKEI